ncbi:MAG: peptidoglycan D,D-transpeptidase FtsI family protein [Phycisphaerae bacterium]
MFERRVQTLLILLSVAGLLVVVRLIDLQVLRADEFREEAANALLLRAETLPFVRGSLLDRTGRVLASDEASWAIKVDYGILAEDPAYLAAQVSRWQREEHLGPGLDRAQVESALMVEIDRMWRRLAAFSGESEAALRQKAVDIRERIGRVRRQVARRRGFDAPVAEERMAHIVVGGLDDQQQVAARREFDLPWVRVEAATQRRYHHAECLAHVLGRTKAVDAELRANDPFAGDDLRSYLADEPVGISGVEYSAEALLRGHRGRHREDRKGNVLEDIKPQSGQDVRLTIRYDLQQRLYDLLGAELPGLPYSPGGAIVVLEVPTREVLALVSYPAFDPNRWQESYADLRRDTVRMPLRFRAVANRYALGSVIKPLTCLAGLSSGLIDEHTLIECTGYLFPDNPRAGASKCWQVHGTGQRKVHGPVNVAKALEGSCNIFMYEVGQLVGVEYLCNFFEMVGFGQPSGISLREETFGINPTPSWLNEVQGRRVRPADARLFAIGQGELAVTPIQAANLMATYADGVHKSVRLLQTDEKPRTWHLPVSQSHWNEIHTGLFNVVNGANGTARDYARLEHPLYALCGKTGSATTPQRPVSYRVIYVDGQGREYFSIIAAGARQVAADEFERLHRGDGYQIKSVTLQEVFPPELPAEGGRHAHAWFAGYLQRIGADRQPLEEVKPRIAFAVLVEFGGSGGRASGPIARKVAKIVIDTLGDDLNPDVQMEPTS